MKYFYASESRYMGTVHTNTENVFSEKLRCVTNSHNYWLIISSSLSVCMKAFEGNYVSDFLVRENDQVRFELHVKGLLSDRNRGRYYLAQQI